MKKIILFSVLGIVVGYVLVCACLTLIPMGVTSSASKQSLVGDSVSPQEKIALPHEVSLHYFPAADPADEYVIVCPGGGYTALSMDLEGYAIAKLLNDAGYTAFVLEYRTGEKIDEFQAPVTDLANAIRYVDEHADTLGVKAGEYALCGFSAGGNLIGLFGTTKYGYARFEGIAKPQMLIMGYPWCNPNNKTKGNLVEYLMHVGLNNSGVKAFLQDMSAIDEMRVPLWVDGDYPRTYMMTGDKDTIVPAWSHGDVLAAAFDANSIPYRYEKFSGLNHGFGAGVGTAAEGWLDNALKYWQDNWYEDKFEPTDSDVAELLNKTGGFVTGFCHPDMQYQVISDAGAEWARIDIGYPPLDDDGNPTLPYQWLKQQAKEYVDNGYKVFCVTAYPSDYIQFGKDPRTPEGKEYLIKTSRFLMEDLQGLVSIMQVTNELSEPQFRAPLTLEESGEFLEIQLRAMYRYRGNIAIGYNISATDFATFLKYTKGCNQYCDYVGIDVYLGCFETLTKNFLPATAWLNYVRAETKKPVILTEFGYINAGERKSDAEKLEILANYGVQGNTLAEAEAYLKQHAAEVIEHENFPEAFRKRIKLIARTDEEIGELLVGVGVNLVSLKSHLYMELEEGIGLTGYPHSTEGQAEYFGDFIRDIVITTDYVCGVIVYKLSDDHTCYVCGQYGCPVETRWGVCSDEYEYYEAVEVLKEVFDECRDSRAHYIE